MSKAPVWRAAAAGAVLAALVLAAPVAVAQDEEAIGRLFSEAEEKAEQGDLEGALMSYELIAERFSEKPAAAEALLRLVTGYRALGRVREAEAAADTLTRDHPSSPQAAGGFVQLGELLVERAGDTEALPEARQSFERAVLLFSRAAYPRLPWRSAGAVQGAGLALRLGLDGEAAAALVDVIDHEPPSLWTARARIELAGLLLDQDRWQEAAELLQQVVDRPWSGEQERAAAALAGTRLALIDRLWLRPASGRRRWLDSRRVPGAPEKPNGVAASDDGRLAVAGAGGSAAVLDAEGRVLRRWEVDDAERISWRRGELLVATKERVRVLLPERRGLNFAAPPDEKKRSLEPLVAVEPAAFGGWFVLADKPERLLHFEAGQRLSRLLVDGKGTQPADLASDRRGRLLVLDRKAKTVTRFTADGEPLGRLISGGWRQPLALAVDAGGNVYVLDRDGRIELFDRDGRKIDSFGPELPGGAVLKRAADLSVDGAGRLWIADSKDGLVVLE